MSRFLVTLAVALTRSIEGSDTPDTESKCPVLVSNNVSHGTRSICDHGTSGEGSEESDSNDFC